MSTSSTDSRTGRGLVWPAPQWLALFYDLAFAAGIIAIASSYGYDHTAEGALWFATAYGIIASVWLLTGGATGAFTSRPREVTTPLVVLIVVQMAAVLMLSVASGDTIASSYGVFDALLAVLLATCMGLGWLARAGSHAMPARSWWLVVAGILTLAVAWLLPETLALVLWLITLAALGGAAGLVALDGRVDVHRMAHRLGELTIILIGEILVKMVLTVGDESLGAVGLVGMGAALLLLVMTFWAYFTGPVTVSNLTGRRRLVWVNGHWSMHVALLGLAVGLSRLLVQSDSLEEPGAVPALLTGPALLVVASLALLDWVTSFSRWRIMALAAGVVALVAVGCALVGASPAVAAYGVGLVPLIAVVIGGSRPRVE